jgi:hypothetical protein
LWIDGGILGWLFTRRAFPGRCWAILARFRGGFWRFIPLDFLQAFPSAASGDPQGARSACWSYLDAKLLGNMKAKFFRPTVGCDKAVADSFIQLDDLKIEFALVHFGEVLRTRLRIQCVIA